MSVSRSSVPNPDCHPDDRSALKRASSRRQYQKRKSVGLCAYFGCPANAASGRLHCRQHLERMSRRNRIRRRARKDQGLCIYCGKHPQFWGVRCVLCRQIFIKDRQALPFGARRALRLFREAEHQLQVEQSRVRARFAVRKLLATGDIKGDGALALRHYAGLDNGGWRTYLEVASLMQISKERVRQLLYPSKLILEQMLDGDVPWNRLLASPDPTRLKNRTRSRPVPNTRSPLNVGANIG